MQIPFKVFPTGFLEKIVFGIPPIYCTEHFEKVRYTVTVKKNKKSQKRQKKRDFVHYLYSTRTGRIMLKGIQHTGALTVAEWFMGTGMSRPLIKRYIKKNNIDMSPFGDQHFRNFQDFFVRRRPDVPVDHTPSHMISPCDGWLSVYPIEKDSRFCIKGSYYSVSDLVQDERAPELFLGGQCLVFRLTPLDYHRYCFIDNGFQGKNHFINGTLHSVQPIAYERVPVYQLNRRMWTLMETENFGTVAQIAVGALLVGGIVNEFENRFFRKGEEMGHFELAGSTIVLLFQRNKIELLPEIRSHCTPDNEYRVLQGQQVGSKKT